MMSDANQSSSSGASPNRCNWCLLSFASENPNDSQRAIKPTFQRRAPRSAECYTCPRVRRDSYPGHDDFERELRSSGDLFNEFLGAVRKRAHMNNGGVPIPRRASKRTGYDVGANDSGEEVDSPAKNINVDEWGAACM